MKMHLEKRYNPLIFLKTALLLCFVLAFQQTILFADDFDDDDDFDDEEELVDQPDWRLERDEILQEIKREVDETVKKLVTRDKTTQFIGAMIRTGRNIPKLGNFANLKGVSAPEWKWPIREPAISLEKIIEGQSFDIDRRAKFEFPDSEREKFVKDAQAKYTMFKLGEKIELVLRGGQGTNTDVEGIYHAITSERVMVGRRYISRKDLDPDTEARFYKELNSIKIEEYVRRENDVYDAKKANWIEDRKREEFPPAFHQAGYVPDPNKTGASIRTAKDDFWLSRRSLHTKIFNFLTTQAKERLTEKLTPERFAEKGYVLAPNENDEPEWMPEHIAEEIKLAKEATEAVGQEGGPDHFDPYGPPPM